MNKTLLTIFAFSLIFILAFSVSSQAETVLNLSVSASSSSTPAFYLQENLSSPIINTSIHRSRDIVISRLMRGEVDAALLSTNEAAKLFNRDIEVQIAGIHTWGLFYLITLDSEINDWADLTGKDIYIPDRGGPLDITFQDMLINNNISRDSDLNVNRGRMREISQLMINNMAETAVLREPFVTQVLIENPQSKIVHDLQSEWDKIYNSKIPQSALVYRKEFAENNPHLIDKINLEYKKAVEEINKQHQTAADLAYKYLEIDKEVTLNSLARLNLDYQKISEVKVEVKNYFEILMNYNHEAIGGRMPNEEFYLE